MKGTGYFAPETQAPSVDPAELEDHDVGAQDVTIEGDGVGPMGPYFERLVEEAHRCSDLAKQARSRGYDPEKEPEIPFAVDLASRVEALVGPEGVAQRIRDLSETMGREELALTVSKQVAAEAFCQYDSPEAALDGAIRTGLAILTEGILVAPLEGVAQVKVRTNDDGTDYADIYFAGPIRAAGGTGQAMSVLIADVVRHELGLGAYKATGSEIERFKEESPAYKKAANHLYTPSPDEIELIVANIPVGINGEGTEQEEVSGNRDLPRVETNALRGGACLVLAEGMTLKAPKILKHVDKLGLEGWGFLEDFVKAQKQDEDGGDEDGGAKGPKIKPNPKYVTELVAGRPVFGHPMAPGGFRLRYGRARTAGLASTAVHPAILHLVDDFLAVGTQMKVERPGKGTVATPCDTIEPPVVRLEDGTVIEVEGCEHALKIRDRVTSILDMGEMLVPFGEFLENNKPLPQAAWCPEWWRLVVEDAGHQPPTLTDMQAARAFAFAEETGTPLHPRFTLLWHDLTTREVTSLAEAVAQGSLEAGRLALPRQGNIKDLLERLGACHEVRATEDGDRLLLDHRCSAPVVRGAGFQATADGLERVRTPDPSLEDPLALAAQLSGVALEPKAPCRIGARMGRPEKAAERAMSPAVHTLVPLGKAGGLQRLVKQAKEQGTIGTSSEDRGQRHRQVEVGTRHCPQCGTETLSLTCKSCQITTEIKGSRAKSRVVHIRELVEQGVERLQLPKLPDGTKGVQGLMSESRIPEPIEKGMLRAHHDISVFKDGTCRYDMTDLPLTHFRPREIGTPVETLCELGYTHDIHGDELTSPDQLLELAPQDIVVNEDGLGYMARVAEFTDDLLTRFYGLKPYYELETPEDLIGHLAVGLAPHTSGGVLCRIIGTTRAQGHWGHPYFHAAKRRNCDGDEDSIMLLLDGLLNFSRNYLPRTRGGQMDAPLTLSTRIDPQEIDKEAHNIDALFGYPRAFFEATRDNPSPKDVEDLLEMVADRLGGDRQYTEIGFTHDTASIDEGPEMSAYKTIGSMLEKMDGQLGLGRKIRAVDEADVASRVICDHFLPDIIGNLKAFSRQTVRCAKCNSKFRRIPLAGRCPKCKNTLTMTVHEASVKKYVKVAKKVAAEYNVDAYTLERLNLAQDAIASLFENDKVKKATLADFL